jgi:hypothetical protein
MSRSETDREVIERSESQALGFVEEIALATLTGGISPGFTPSDGHTTTITDKETGTSVTGSGSTSAEADQNAWDRLESERRR